ILSSRVFKLYQFDAQDEQPLHIFKDILLPAMANGETLYVFHHDLWWTETGIYKSFYVNEQEFYRVCSKQEMIDREYRWRQRRWRQVCLSLGLS
ncbi:MAG: hypothetical protein NZ480_07715, partial [Bdellovibrionaceae bacterium]|nr:hypothetical protein [Pseudobdellovibrionaceae bacterium]